MQAAAIMSAPVGRWADIDLDDEWEELASPPLKPHQAPYQTTTIKEESTTRSEVSKTTNNTVNSNNKKKKKRKSSQKHETDGKGANDKESDKKTQSTPNIVVTDKSSSQGQQWYVLFYKSFTRSQSINVSQKRFRFLVNCQSYMVHCFSLLQIYALKWSI